MKTAKLPRRRRNQGVADAPPETTAVLAEYRQVCDLRDRAYAMLIGQGEAKLDLELCRNLPLFYEKMLILSLQLSGKAALIGVGRLGRGGVRDLIERMVCSLGGILRELGVIREEALAQYGDEITRRMLAAAPGWFEVAEADHRTGKRRVGSYGEAAKGT